MAGKAAPGGAASADVPRCDCAPAALGRSDPARASPQPPARPTALSDGASGDSLGRATARHGLYALGGGRHEGGHPRRGVPRLAGSPAPRAPRLASTAVATERGPPAGAPRLQCHAQRPPDVSAFRPRRSAVPAGAGQALGCRPLSAGVARGASRWAEGGCWQHRGTRSRACWIHPCPWSTRALTASRGVKKLMRLLGSST